jgi:hypothetical protein
VSWVIVTATAPRTPQLERQRLDRGSDASAEYVVDGCARRFGDQDLSVEAEVDAPAPGRPGRPVVIDDDIDHHSMTHCATERAGEAGDTRCFVEPGRVGNRSNRGCVGSDDADARRFAGLDQCRSVAGRPPTEPHRVDVRALQCCHHVVDQAGRETDRLVGFAPEPGLTVLLVVEQHRRDRLRPLRAVQDADRVQHANGGLAAIENPQSLQRHRLRHLDTHSANVERRSAATLSGMGVGNATVP